MAKQRISKGKTIRPTFFVFCEGESEESYVRYLKAKFRLPIEIKSKVAGLSINNRYISSCKKGMPTHEKDKDFLIYDLDRDDVWERLQRIQNATIIVSVPCFELWYLLHCQDQRAYLTSIECLAKLQRHISEYQKGAICEKVKAKLNDKADCAKKRACKLSYPSNPSTNMHLLVEELEKVQNV